MFDADARSAAVERLCTLASAALSLPPGRFADRWLERRIHLAAFDRWNDRIQYDVGRVLEPTGLEWEWLPVPALVPFYVPLRVVRLVLSGLSAQRRDGHGRRSAPISDKP